MQLNQDIQRKIINRLTDKYVNNIAITFHIAPDGDAFGSGIALALALQSLGKNVDIISSAYSSSFCPLLKGINIIRKAKKNYDLCIILDCSELERIIINPDDIARFLIVIDHHQCSKAIGNLYWNEENTAATAILIFSLIKKMKIKITKEIATALYLGIFSDTSGFTNSNVNSYTLFKAAELASKGANLELINKICKIKTLTMIKFMSEKLSQLIFDTEYKIIYLVLLREDLKKYHLTYDIVEFLMDELKNIEEANIAYLFIESSNDIKIKARSKGNIHVNDIMKYFGGNGHYNSSGCKINSLNIYQIVDSVITRTRNYLTEKMY